MPLPSRHGLYEPAMEHDACGLGFVAHLRGEKSRSIVEQGLDILVRLSHRAATGADRSTEFPSRSRICLIPPECVPQQPAVYSKTEFLHKMLKSSGG